MLALFRWFVDVGWVAVLSAATLFVLLLQELRFWQMSHAIKSLELRHNGLMDRIVVAYNAIKRVTDSFPEFEGDEERTRLKRRPK